MSTQEHNKRVAYRFYEEVFNSGRLEVMDELASAALLARDGALPPGLSVHGPEPYKRTVAMFRAAFPDLRCEVEEMVAENDTVAVRVIMKGTNLGEFLGVPATGKRVRYPGMDFFHFKDGKMVEHWTATDDLGLMQQLGVVSSSEPWSRPISE